MPMSKIQVTVPTVGGGFGGKGEASNNELIAALLARKSRRPVKVTYSRKEVFFQHRGRHPIEMKIRMGVDKEGYLTAIDYDGIMDGGAYGAWGIIILFYTAAMLHLPYKITNVRFNAKRIYTNKPTCGPMRGLGGVQPRFALESMMDELAIKLGMSPYDMKLKNAIDMKHDTVSGVHVRHSEYKKCLTEVVNRSGYLEKHQKLPYGRGVGLAGGYYISGTAYTLYMSYKPHSSALIRLDTESGVTLQCGATDIGQGSNMVLAMMCGRKTRPSPTSRSMSISGDTTNGPLRPGLLRQPRHGGGRCGSLQGGRQTAGTAATGGGGTIGGQRGPADGGDGEIYSMFEKELRMPFWTVVEKFIDAHGPLTATGSYTPPRRTGDFKGGNVGHSPTYGFTAQWPRSRWIPRPARSRWCGYNEAGDCGQPINPLIGRGAGRRLHRHGDGSGAVRGNQARRGRPADQSEPARLQGADDAGYPRYQEPLRWTPTIPNSPFGAKEAGEGPIQPTIPAIFNAIYDAIGVRFTELPVTPEEDTAGTGRKE